MSTRVTNTLLDSQRALHVCLSIRTTNYQLLPTSTFHIQHSLLGHTEKCVLCARVLGFSASITAASPQSPRALRRMILRKCVCVCVCVCLCARAACPGIARCMHAPDGCAMLQCMVIAERAASARDHAGVLYVREDECVLCGYSCLWRASSDALGIHATSECVEPSPKSPVR